MTDTLAEHVADMHRNRTWRWRRGVETLAQAHAAAHHRYAQNHYHAGANLGPSHRPIGWATGEAAVRRDGS